MTSTSLWEALNFAIRSRKYGMASGLLSRNRTGSRPLELEQPAAPAASAAAGTPARRLRRVICWGESTSLSSRALLAGEG